MGDTFIGYDSIVNMYKKGLILNYVMLIDLSEIKNPNDLIPLHSLQSSIVLDLVLF